MVLGSLSDVGPFHGLNDLIAVDVLGSLEDSDTFENLVGSLGTRKLVSLGIFEAIWNLGCKEESLDIYVF